MDVRFSRFSSGQKYAVILSSVALLTLLPVAFKRSLPNWVEGIMLISGAAIGLSSWRLATELGVEMEMDQELKQFEKVVRVKQLEVEASARILEYQNLLMPTLVSYDPNIHQMATEPIESQTSVSEITAEFLQFLNGNGTPPKDSNGYFSVSKLQQNWGKNKKMNAAQFKAFLSQIVEAEMGEFDPTGRLWKPLPNSGES